MFFCDRMQLDGMEQPTNLRSLDLNLLVNLEALIATRSITRAAQKVGISQSTMSHALQRLRQTFNDEIVRPSPQGMVATQRTLQLA
jgi:LysR family transcriptional activator of mexEF-oprN operon